MKNWVLGWSILLNLLLLVVLVFLNEKYGLLSKVHRFALVEGRVPGLVPPHEWNRNYQFRREMFRLDRNKSAEVLMLGDSLTAHGEWNAMLGEPMVANRGIDGDTSAGVLARIGDDADFRGDTVVIWIGTNDVLQGGAAEPVAERIMEAARGKAEILKSEKLKRNLTTDFTTERQSGREEEQPKVGPKGEGAGATESKDEAGLILAGQAGASGSDSLTSKLADAPVSSPATSGSLLATAPQTQVFVFGIPPLARWWEGARERNETIREINERLAKGAQENGYRFIELESVLADENGFLRGEVTTDGVHLSAKGYMAVLQKVKEGPLRNR